MASNRFMPNNMTKPRTKVLKTKRPGRTRMDDKTRAERAVVRPAPVQPVPTQPAVTPTAIDPKSMTPTVMPTITPTP